MEVEARVKGKQSYSIRLGAVSSINYKIVSLKEL